jgi:hypothetical protein
MISNYKLFLCPTLLAVSLLSYAANPPTVYANDGDGGNSGFTSGDEKVSQRKKFPMCTDFFKVKWIGNEFGYVETDIYKNHKKLGKMKSLIHLEETMVTDRLDLYEAEKRLGMDKIFQIVRNGTYIKGTVAPSFSYENQNYVFLRNKQDGLSYSDHLRNVCMVYPSNERAVFLETRLIRSESEVEDLDKTISKISEVLPGFKAEHIVDRTALDINQDGVMDFLTEESFFISKGNSYQVVEKLGYVSTNERYFIFGVKGGKKQCRIYNFYPTFFTTDGKTLFMNNQCDLSTLTED